MISELCDLWMADGARSRASGELGKFEVEQSVMMFEPAEQQTMHCSW